MTTGSWRAWMSTSHFALGLAAFAALAACSRSRLELLPGDGDSTDPAPVTDNIVFRSVGPGNGVALAQGANNPLTLTGHRAVFSLPLPDRVGVGDVLQYDGDGDGVVDALAFVYRRDSATSLVLKSAAGGTPHPTAQPDTAWSLWRAYVSLSDAISGVENPGIAAAWRDFDDFSAGLDLVARDLEWRIACYADNVDTTPISISGVTTDTTHRLTVFTPSLSTEVGVSQRHRGVPSSVAYRLEVTDGLAIRNEARYVTIIGLQVKSISTGAGSNHGGIRNVAAGDAASDVGIADNLVGAENAVGTDDSQGIRADPESDIGVSRIWNNIVFGFQGATLGCKGILASNGAVYAYHNTIYDCRYGIDASSLMDTLVLKNNLSVCHAVDASSLDFGPMDLAGHAGNVSSDDTSPDPFVNRTVVFKDPSALDFHLDSADTAAKDQGVSLLSDPWQAVVDDVDGEARRAPVDVGADEI